MVKDKQHFEYLLKKIITPGMDLDDFVDFIDENIDLVQENQIVIKGEDYDIYYLHEAIVSDLELRGFVKGEETLVENTSSLSSYMTYTLDNGVNIQIGS